MTGYLVRMQSLRCARNNSADTSAEYGMLYPHTRRVVRVRACYRMQVVRRTDLLR